MATSAASRSTPRWERTEEPGTAFSGLGRPGRGSRGRGGGRGGRGAGRGTPRESKTISGATTTPPKQDPPLLTINPSATPPVQPLPATTSDQTSPSSSKLKPSSRKLSRAIPTPLNVQVTVQVTPPQIAPSPSSARTPHKRRRSQAGKPNGNHPAKAPATISKDAHAKSNKSRLESGPSTSAKDTPPHLQHRLDVRQGIDALVERVRAVAMDNRPTTPGSHIDWAGDDDDSLPDLNDWGVNTSTFASTDSEGISPIILEGLKTLPDIVPRSPLRQLVTLDGKTGDNSTKDSMPPTSDFPSLTPSMGDDDAPITTTNTPIVLKAAPEQVSEVKVTLGPEQQSSLPKPSPSAKVEYSRPPASNGRPWHPSLPAKPAASSVVPLKLRPGATPMRSHLYAKSLANKETPLSPMNDSPGQINAGGTDATLSTNPVPPIPDLVPAQEKKMPMRQDQEPVVKSTSTGASDDGSKLLDVGPQSNGVLVDDNKVEGLEASMHAPKAKSISTSTPSEMSSYSQLQASTIPRNRYWNNAKDQTPGQVYPQPRNGDRQGRSSRSAAGRGGLHSHGRNHSAPSVGSQNSHQRVHGSRPVITGDAISRIARTIVNTST